MTLSDQSALAQFPPFADRVLVAALQAARDVAAEAPAVGGDPRVASLRKTLATNVLANPAAQQQRFSWAVAANPAVTYASTDSDLQYTVNSLWDALAGV